MKQQGRWLIIVAISFTLVVFGTHAFTQGQNAVPAASPALTCDMQQYKSMTGLTAAVQGNLVHGCTR